MNFYYEFLLQGELLTGVCDKGDDEIWLLFYWDLVIENYLKANCG